MAVDGAAAADAPRGASAAAAKIAPRSGLDKKSAESVSTPVTRHAAPCGRRIFTDDDLPTCCCGGAGAECESMLPSRITTWLGSGVVPVGVPRAARTASRRRELGVDERDGDGVVARNAAGDVVDNANAASAARAASTAAARAWPGPGVDARRPDIAEEGMQGGEVGGVGRVERPTTLSSVLSVFGFGFLFSLQAFKSSHCPVQSLSSLTGTHFLRKPFGF